MRISLICMRSWCLGFPIWLTWFACVSVLCFDYDYGTFCHYGLWMRICSRNWIKLLLDNRNLSVFLWMMRILELVLMNVISMSLFISLGGKDICFQCFKVVMCRAWQWDELSIQHLDDNFLQFCFQSVETLQFALTHGPWNFENRLLVIKSWEPIVEPVLEDFQSAEFWIHNEAEVLLYGWCGC